MFSFVPTRADAATGIMTCCAAIFLLAPTGYAQELAKASRVIALGYTSTARIQPLPILSSQEEVLSADPAEIESQAELAPAGQTDKVSQATDSVLAVALAAPAGTSTDKTPASGKLFGNDDPESLFGTRGGYFHPSLLLQEEWTDNLYNLKLVEHSNSLTSISPGFWLGLPRMDDPPITFNTNNSAIGGTRFLITESQSYERILAYLAGNLDYKTYSTDSTLNYSSWRVEGYSRYKMPVGLTMHLLDRWSSDRDRFDRGSFPLANVSFVEDDPVLFEQTPKAWDYDSNLLNASLMYEVSDSYRAKIDYNNFLLAYADDANSWLNRTDNTIALSLFYIYSPKTSIFAEYNFADTTYQDDNDNNSTSVYYYGGLSWKGAKLSLMAKAGYQAKEYESVHPQTQGAFSMESLFDWLLTDKTKIAFTLYKAIEETNVRLDHGMDTLAGTLRYEQRFTYRLRGTCEAGYELNDHTGFARAHLGLLEEERQDTTFSLRPSLEYSFRDWLTAGLTYSYEQRNSTDSRYDYSTQTVTLGINFTL